MSCSRVARSGICRGVRSALEVDLDRLWVAATKEMEEVITVVVMMGR